MSQILKERYKEDVIPALMKTFGMENIMQVPRLEKVVVNIGVGEAIAYLEDQKESEKKKWDEVMNQGIKQQLFFWDYAEAYFEPIDGDPIFTGEWVSDKGKIFIFEQNGKEITVKWETKYNGEKITGSICNLSAEIEYLVKEKLIESVDGIWGRSRKGYGYFSKDRKSFHLHIPEKEHFLFFSINKKEPLEK